MAKWTLQEYIKALREKVDEPETDFLTDDELGRYINHAIDNMAHELQIQEYKSYTLADQQIVPILDICPMITDPDPTVLPTEHDFLQLRLMMIDGKIVDYGKLEDIINQKEVVVKWGDNFRFTTAKTGTLEMFYTRRPKKMVQLTDKSDVPEIYQEIPLFYAQSQAYKKDGEMELAQGAMAEFEQRKSEMKIELEQVQAQENGSNVDITYFSGGEF